MRGKQVHHDLKNGTQELACDCTIRGNGWQTAKAAAAKKGKIAASTVMGMYAVVPHAAEFLQIHRHSVIKMFVIVNNYLCITLAYCIYNLLVDSVPCHAIAYGNGIVQFLHRPYSSDFHTRRQNSKQSNLNCGNAINWNSFKFIALFLYDPIPPTESWRLTACIGFLYIRKKRTINSLSSE